MNKVRIQYPEDSDSKLIVTEGESTEPTQRPQPRTYRFVRKLQDGSDEHLDQRIEPHLVLVFAKEVTESRMSAQSMPDSLADNIDNKAYC